MKINVSQAAALLTSHDRIALLCHKSPDGDTVGSACALYYALVQLKKQVQILCSDPLPKLFAPITAGYQHEAFVPEYIVTVDVADTALLGASLQQYADKVDLCIDHHISNTNYAASLCLDADAAAACEIILEVIEQLGVSMSAQIADSLYTGVATDTGCFKFSNTTAKTHQTAAKLMEYGADFASINRRIFDTKSREQIRFEQQIYNSMEFFYGGKCCVVVITEQMLRDCGVEESEVDGISGLARGVEGVEVGITIREKAQGAHKVSLRTGETIDASRVCARLGGGGHVRAAGCSPHGTLEEVKRRVLDEVKQELT